MIYFIGNKEESVVKIGFTDNSTVEKRLKSIQTGCPYKLSVLKLYPEGTMKLEKALHAVFDKYRLNGEWFKLSKKIEDFLLFKDSLKDFITKDVESNPFYTNGDFSTETADITDDKMKLSAVSLQLLVYIEGTTSIKRFKFSGLKMNNFMKATDIKSRSTVYKGITELCRYGFIAPDVSRGYYWINPFRMFHGDRRTKYPENLKIID